MNRPVEIHPLRAVVNHLRAALLLTVALTSLPASAQLNWRITNGPYGGTIIGGSVVTGSSTGAGIVQASNGDLYTHTAGGVFRSTDNAQNWTAINGDSPTVLLTGLAVAPDDSLVVMAGGKAILRSTNNGVNWVRSNTSVFVTTSPQDLNGCSNNASIVSSGGSLWTRGCIRLYRSDDNGVNWQRVPNTGITGVSLYTDFLRTPDGTLYQKTLGSTTLTFFVSTDGGQTWEQRDTGLPEGAATEAGLSARPVVDGGNQACVVTNGTNNAASRGIYCTRNKGVLWEQVRQLDVAGPLGLAFSADGNTAYVSGIGAGLAFSSVLRASLSSPADPPVIFDGRFEDQSRAFTATALLMPQDGRLLIGLDDDRGLFRANEDESLFEFASRGLVGPALESFSADASGQLLGTEDTPTATTARIQYSANGGVQWQSLLIRNANNELGSAQKSMITRDGSLLVEMNFFGTVGNAIFRSANGGQSWAPATGDNPAAGGNSRIEGFSQSPLADKTIYTFGNNGLFKSIDDGQTFTRMTGPPGATELIDFKIGPDGAMYVIHGNVLASSLVRSRDGGTTWETLIGTEPIRQLRLLCVNAPPFPVQDKPGSDIPFEVIPAAEAIYVKGAFGGSFGTICVGNVMWRSVDDGQTFLPFSNGLSTPGNTNRVGGIGGGSSFIRASNGALFLTGSTGTGVGVFRSDDCGETWQGDGEGLPAVEAAHDVDASKPLKPATQLRRVHKLVEGDGHLYVSAGSHEDGGAGVYKAALPPPVPACAPVKAAAFSFQDRFGVAKATVLESNSITATGFSGTVRLGVVDGEYSKDNGATWTKAEGTAAPGDSIRVRHTSANTDNTAASTRLVLGNVSAIFTSITTSGGDTSPDTFSFTPLTDALCNVDVESGEVTITGLGVPAPISIIGGHYRIGTGTYTRQTGFVQNNNRITLRLRTSHLPGGQQFTTLTIGDKSATFTATTGNGPSCNGVGTPPDTTPNPFNFTPQTNVPVGTLVESNSITVSGLGATDRAPITVSNGEYCTGACTSYTTAAGTVGNGDTVRVRHRSSAMSGLSVTTSLTIGGVLGSFTSTTAGAGGGSGGGGTPSASVPTRGGSVTVQTDEGTVVNLRTVSDPANAPASFRFPSGFFAFDIENVPTGGSVEITLNLPANQRPNALVKCIGSTCAEYPATILNNTIRFTLTDGGQGDADGLMNGRISDPAGPAELLNAVLDAAGQLVVAAAGNGTLSNFRAIARPSVASGDFQYPSGFFAFEVIGLVPGSASLVTLQLPGGSNPSTLFECRSTYCDVAPNHRISGDTVSVTLVDGGLGDADGSANGTIRFAGAPGRTEGGGGSMPAGVLALLALVWWRRRTC